MLNFENTGYRKFQFCCEWEGKKMDKKFEQFAQWYREKEYDWNVKGITIEKVHLEVEKGHHYSINLKCENGLGNIHI